MRKNRNKEVTARRAEIARFYLQGLTGLEISELVSVSPSQVSRDLKFINKQWQAETLTDISEKKARDLAELTAIKRELWEAWQKTKNKDPRFMSELLKALKQISELLGYNSTQKLAVTVEDMNDSEIDKLLLKILNNNENED